LAVPSDAFGVAVGEHYNGSHVNAASTENGREGKAGFPPIFRQVWRSKPAAVDLCYDAVTEFARLTAVCGSIARFQTLVIRLPLPHSPRTPVNSAAVKAAYFLLSISRSYTHV
jgi:hypothetical protein